MDTPFEHGGFSWSELITKDVKAAKEFYTKLFGWETEDMSMPEGMTYTVIKVGGKGIGGIMKTPKEAKNLPPMWVTYVTVDDVNQIVKDAKKLGAKVHVEPRDIPDVGRFAVLIDPQGAAINVITYKKM